MIVRDRVGSSLGSRREFVKGMALTGTAWWFLANGVPAWAQSPSGSENPGIEYRYRTVSVDHLRELQGWLEELSRDGKLSPNETFRKYIGAFEYAPPPALPKARSLVVVALRQRIAAVTFHHGGRAHDILIPTGYSDDGVSLEAFKDRITREVLKTPAGRLERAKLPLKTLAVRSGLAEYGKNNVTFVGDFGSFHQLLAFYTDVALEDSWGQLKMLRLCKGCSICTRACPTQCIREESFVIDVGRCIPLYNELPAPFPAWLSPRVHHTLVGCLRCQDTCPANQEGMRNIEKIADISEEETELLLNGGENKALQQSIVAKLKRYPEAEDFAYLTRNFRLAWANVVNA